MLIFARVWQARRNGTCGEHVILALHLHEVGQVRNVRLTGLLLAARLCLLHLAPLIACSRVIEAIKWVLGYVQ